MITLSSHGIRQSNHVQGNDQTLRHLDKPLSLGSHRRNRSLRVSDQGTAVRATPCICEYVCMYILAYTSIYIYTSDYRRSLD
jgi:hypothetical protein